jgi:hypothetical protein
MLELIYPAAMVVLMLIMMYFFKKITDKTNISLAISKMNLEDLKKIKHEIDINIYFREMENKFITKIKG